jgi:hypothetical protein
MPSTILRIKVLGIRGRAGAALARLRENPVGRQLV